MGQGSDLAAADAMTLVVYVEMAPVRGAQDEAEDSVAFAAENLTQALGWLGARIGRGAQTARYEVTIDVRDE